MARGSKLFAHCLFTIAVLVIIYVRHGYVFGSDDQSETLPYVLWLNNHTLNPTDFFLQSIIHKSFNERWFFVAFIRLFSHPLNYYVFLFHVLGTASLLWGIYFYTSNRLNGFSKTWLAILLPLVFVYNFNTGSSELYDNTFNPGYAANILAIWVFILIDRTKIFWAFLLLIVVTFLQPLIGALLAFVIFISEATKDISQNSSVISKFLKLKVGDSKLMVLISCFILYCFTAGIYVYSLSKVSFFEKFFN